MTTPEKNLKILWVIPKWTLPVTDGARVATDSLIRTTIAAGAEVDVICLANQDEKTDSEKMKAFWGVGEVFVVPRDLPPGGLAKKLYYLKEFLISPLIPLTFSSFSKTHLKKSLRKQMDVKSYDVVLLDGLHLGATLLKDGVFHESPGTKIIYRAHNIEVDLWKKAYAEKTSPVIKLALLFQSRLVDKFEKMIIRNSHGVAAIAREDLEELTKVTSKKVELVPLGLNFSSPVESLASEGTKFLFIGRLDWPPNKDGLEWVLKEVWPEVMKNRQDATLKIVGSGNKEWLKKYAHLPGLEIIGFVDSVRDAYADCDFTIVPVFYGSGTRIKVIESFAMGRRLISTKMGVQGADLTNDDYVGAESKEDWVNTLSQIKSNSFHKEKLVASRAKVAQNFDEKNIGLRFYDWLKTF